MPPPDRICILIDNLNGGGAERVASHLANGWAEQHRYIQLITINSESIKDYRLDSRVTRHTLGLQGRVKGPLGGIRGNIHRVLKIRHIVRSAKAEVLIAFILPMNILAIIACMGLPCRVIISERNDPKLQTFGALWNVMRRILYRFANKVTANSQGAVESLCFCAPVKKLAYVPNPIIIPEYCGPHSARANQFLAVGRLVPQKGYDILLNALHQVNRAVTKWRLVVLGDGPLLEELKQMAESLGIQDKIDWHGRVEDPFPFYQTSWLFLMPSRFEGTPNALLEAMSCGLTPIVSNSSPGPLEVVKHDLSGLVVASEDPLSLANAIIELTHNNTKRQRLAAGARECVSHLQIDTALAEWDRVIS